MSTPDGTVFIVDDDPSHLKSLARLLRASGFSTRCFSSAAEFLQNRPLDAPGCVVADLEMPGMSGIELQEALARTRNPLPVVFLTGHGDIPTTVKAMRRGAEDFLTKRASKDEILGAIRRAMEHDEPTRRQRERQRSLRDRFTALTPRECEVLTHVLNGQLNKQIASDLRIDERSVKRHRTNLMRKLQVQSVAALAQLAVEADWSRRA